MIELRTYEGDAAEISQFAQQAWRQTYAGKMPIPLWDERFFDWQLLSPRPGGRDYLVVAYDGPRLVGSLLGEKFRFRLHGREFDATMGSWLTVHPDCRGQGLASQLVEEQRRRHRATGAVFNLGYGYIAKAISMGPKFWKSLPNDVVVLGTVGWWVRLLDQTAVAKWELSALMGWGARLLSLVQGRPTPPRDSTGIRPYRPDDLPACLALVHTLLERVDMGYLWSAERLAHQLQYKDVPRTLVIEHAGRVAGFVNWYRLDFLGRQPIEAAMIDLVAFGPLPAADQTRLLRAVVAQMHEEGIKMALGLRLPALPWRAFVGAGFVPLPPELSFICCRMDPTFDLSTARRLHVHFR